MDLGSGSMQVTDPLNALFSLPLPVILRISDVLEDLLVSSYQIQLVLTFQSIGFLVPTLETWDPWSSQGMV